jgi:hypothetical protein
VKVPFNQVACISFDAPTVAAVELAIGGALNGGTLFHVSAESGIELRTAEGHG